MMIEPTETESKETLDQFIAAMKSIAEEARTDPELVHGAPHTTKYGRFDESGRGPRTQPALASGPHELTAPAPPHDGKWEEASALSLPIFAGLCHNGRANNK